MVTRLASPATEQGLQSRVPSSRKALSFQAFQVLLLDAFQASLEVLVNKRTNAEEFPQLSRERYRGKGGVTSENLLSHKWALAPAWCLRGCAVGSYSAPCWLPPRSGAPLPPRSSCDPGCILTHSVLTAIAQAEARHV